MSHGDVVDKIPDGFNVIAKTDHAPYAAIADQKRKIYGVQFHPESIASEFGHDILKNFLNIAHKFNSGKS